MPAMLSQLHVGFDQTLEEAFPKADPGVAPFGGRVLLQIRSPKSKTKSGIILTDDTKDTILWNTGVAKVIACGPLAFKDKATGEDWTEGAWAKPGDYVKVPKYGGDRWQVDLPRPKNAKPSDAAPDPALFILVNDHEIYAKVTGDPLAIKAFV